MKPFKIALLLISVSLGLLGTPSILAADNLPIIGGQKPRPQPKPILPRADVIVEWQETLDDCSQEKLCIQGGLYNQGLKPAAKVKLRIEIGASSLGKPRLVKLMPVDQPLMNPGDRQESYFELERKTPYKDYKGRTKITEVGKFNFRIIPLWSGKK